jgi:hypothetical protein
VVNIGAKVRSQSNRDAAIPTWRERRLQTFIYLNESRKYGARLGICLDNSASPQLDVDVAQQLGWNVAYLNQLRPAEAVDKRCSLSINGDTIKSLDELSDTLQVLVQRLEKGGVALLRLAADIPAPRDVASRNGLEVLAMGEAFYDANALDFWLYCTPDNPV